MLSSFSTYAFSAKNNVLENTIVANTIGASHLHDEKASVSLPN